jgi:hypothetical protein
VSSIEALQLGSRSLTVVCISCHPTSTFLLTAIGFTVNLGLEEHRFFKQGRVFAMFWTETAGEPRGRTRSDNGTMTELEYTDPAISSGRFGQVVRSQLRRFVIVKINRKQHFVLAW